MFILNFLDTDGLIKTKLWSNQIEDDFIGNTILNLKLKKENFLINDKIGIFASKKENLNKLQEFYLKYKDINYPFLKNGFYLNENSIEIFYIMEPLLKKETELLASDGSGSGSIQHRVRKENLDLFVGAFNNFFKEDEALPPIVYVDLKDGDAILDADLGYLNKFLMFRITIPLLRMSKFPNDPFDKNFDENEVQQIDALNLATVTKDLIEEYEDTGPFFY